MGERYRPCYLAPAAGCAFASVQVGIHSFCHAFVMLLHWTVFLVAVFADPIKYGFFGCAVTRVRVSEKPVYTPHIDQFQHVRFP